MILYIYQVSKMENKNITIKIWNFVQLDTEFEKYPLSFLIVRTADKVILIWTSINGSDIFNRQKILLFLATVSLKWS